MEDMKSDIHIMIYNVQSLVMSELTRLKDSQQLLEERLTTIESDLAAVAEQHNEVPTFASTPDQPITNRRKRHTPVEMQVEPTLWPPTILHYYINYYYTMHILHITTLYCCSCYYYCYYYHCYYYYYYYYYITNYTTTK